jgi:hypothetical protein
MMSRSESYHCDVCGKLKMETDLWWMAWVDCFNGGNPGEDQPLMKLTRWHKTQAHEDGVKHLCGARCSETYMDRWITSQREHPEAHCET